MSTYSPYLAMKLHWQSLEKAQWSLASTPKFWSFKIVSMSLTSEALLYSPKKHKEMPGCGAFSFYDVGPYISFTDFTLIIDNSIDNLVSYMSIGQSSCNKLDYAQPRALDQPATTRQDHCLCSIPRWGWRLGGNSHYWTLFRLRLIGRVQYIRWELSLNWHTSNRGWSTANNQHSNHTCRICQTTHWSKQPSRKIPKPVTFGHGHLFFI